MLRFLADENIEPRFVEALRARVAGIDLVTAREAGLAHTPDDVILRWAAEQGRIVITHDVATLIQLAHERAGRGEPMPGVIPRADARPLDLVDAVALALGASAELDWEGRVVYLPL